MSNLQVLREERVGIRDAMPMLKSFLEVEREASAGAVGQKSGEESAADANHALPGANLGEDVLLQLQLVQSEMEGGGKR